MGTFWKFLRAGRNRAVLSWLGAAGFAAFVGMWTVFDFLSPRIDATPISIDATCGSVAIGGDVHESTIHSNQCVEHPHVGRWETVRDTYFNKPEILYYNETAEIKLTVEPKELTESGVARVFAGLKGKIEHSDVKIGPFITADLSAPKTSLEIVPRNDRVQAVKKGQTVIFVWYVTPLKIGSIPIRLDLNTQDSASKDAPINTIQVMQEEWIVDARGMSWIKYQIVELQPIGVAICGAGAALGSLLGFFGVKLFGSKAKSNDDNTG